MSFLQPNHTSNNVNARDMEWSCGYCKEPIWWPQGRLWWSWKTTTSLYPTMVILSLSWVCGHPHKIELSCPYRDLYITNGRSFFGKNKKKVYMKRSNIKIEVPSKIWRKVDHCVKTVILICTNLFSSKYAIVDKSSHLSPLKRMWAREEKISFLKPTMQRRKQFCILL